ncbi:hypothetical protein DAPPUDRAFT_65920, partial [Daphnia pulex]
PLGILREPFFNLDLPRYMTYGNLGVVIGHEIVHGFDVNDRYGNMTQWWSESLMREFSQRADCFIQQYAAFTIDHMDKPVSPPPMQNRTLGENVCDSGGLAHAWTAYKSNSKSGGEEIRSPEYRLPGVNYTDNQLFFSSLTDRFLRRLSFFFTTLYLIPSFAHSPGKYRANGVLQNSPTFSQFFNCRLDSPMNPANKCQLWS